MGVDKSNNPAATPLRLSVRAAEAPIELAAGAVLRRCAREFGLAAVPTPVPVEAWIERPLGYRLGYVDERDMGPGVQGRARPLDGEIDISESLLGHPGRLRFTCAHELGHLILHKDAAALTPDGERPGTSGSPVVEREADRFAAALLMPVGEVEASMRTIGREHGLAASTWGLLREGDVRSVWLWRKLFLPSLVCRFEVSAAAMVYRCRELRLPGSKRLLRPSLVPLLLAPDDAVHDLGLDRVRVVGGVPVVAP